MNDNRVAFIGAGNMARCVIAAMIKAGYPKENIMAANRSEPKLTELAADFGIHTSLNNIEAANWADVIVLAVKPQMMQDVCTALVEAAPEISEKLFVTLAAGITVARYQQWLGQIRLVRAMPNTPALVGLGMTGLFARDDAGDPNGGFNAHAQGLLARTFLRSLFPLRQQPQVPDQALAKKQDGGSQEQGADADGGWKPASREPARRQNQRQFQQGGGHQTDAREHP